MSSERRYPSEHEARLDPLCRPLTLAEVLERTGRSRSTINRWVTEGRVNRYRIEHPPQSVYLWREIAEAELETRNNARRGRPRPRADATDGDGVDTES